MKHDNINIMNIIVSITNHSAEWKGDRQYSDMVKSTSSGGFGH